MAGLALRMAVEFKRYMDLENESAKEGKFDQATYYMSKKWEVSKAADREGISKEFSQTLKELKVY